MENKANEGVTPTPKDREMKTSLPIPRGIAQRRDGQEGGKAVRVKK